MAAEMRRWPQNADMIFLMDESGYFLEFLGSNSGELLFAPSQIVRKPIGALLPTTEAAEWLVAIKTALQTQETQVIRVDGFASMASGQRMEARMTACGVDRILASLLLVSSDSRESPQDSSRCSDVFTPPSLSSGKDSASPPSAG